MRRNLRLLREQGYARADFYFGKGAGSLLYNLRLDLIADWMNSGQMKERLFALIRHLMEDAGYDCFVFACDTWSFEANKLFMALPEERAEELLATKSIPELAALGYGRSAEAIVVTAQTPELTCMSKTLYRRDPVNPDKVSRVEKTETAQGDESDIGGRTKMFGEITDPGTAAAYKKLRGKQSEFKRRGLDLPGATVLINIATEEP
jgi:hypothetical protein